MSLSILLLSIFTFVQLNCENLFDCKDDSVTNDNEYLPEGSRKWTPRRYWQKQHNLARVIASCAGDSTDGSLPHFVALCEVENDSVLYDLTRLSMLRRAGYEYFVTESLDTRGIDVALLYQPRVFTPITSRPLRVQMPEGERPTRDILYVSGTAQTDTLHIFVVHSPSRYGGVRKSNGRRMAVAEVLCSVIDSIRSVTPEANIIISGDFNDEEHAKALKRICRHGMKNATANVKGNKGYHKATGKNGTSGTYKYQGNWQRIDHILLSTPLYNRMKDACINDAEFLLTEDTKHGGVKPRRTFAGNRYDSEGYSDHLPLVVRLNVPDYEERPCIPNLTPVSPAYSRTSVNTTIFRNNSLVTDGRHQYVCFYDSLGYVTLGRRELIDEHGAWIDGGGPWTLHRTQYRGNVKDAHNVISMMVDGEGYLHVAFDHHDHPLRYCRSLAPHSLELGEKEAMTGIDEQKVTYPEFYRLAGGDLLFAYRSGSSGRGNLVMNRYSVKERRWHRVQDVLIDGENKRNAYWQMYVDASGTIHLSWVWRETWHVETNHDLCYARSRDGGKTWEKSDGSLYTLPIRHDNAEYAWRIPQNSELINQTSMSADDNGNPYIATYWRDSTSTVPQYRLVWHDGSRWHSRQVGERHQAFSLKGGGTKKIPIARPRLVADKGRAAYIFRDEERGSRVTVAFTDDIVKGVWQFRDLTPFVVDAWEPSYDTELWKQHKRLDIFVQHSGQGDGERTTDLAPTTVYVLELYP